MPKIESEVAEEVLRAAIVYAHASLEEAVRDIAKRRIASWPKEPLDEVPLKTQNRLAEKFRFHDLLPYADKSVRSLNDDAAKDRLNSRSFTPLSNILDFLKKIGIDVKKVLSDNPVVFGTDTELYLRLASDKISRRHRIVHSQDYEHGRFTRAPIDQISVMSMIAAVWCLIAVVIVEEMRNYPGWLVAIKVLVETFHSNLASYATPDSQLSKAINMLVAGNCWPYPYNSESVEAADRPERPHNKPQP